MNYSNISRLDELVSSCMYGFYVRYDTLAAIINANFQGSDATTLNIFIDVRCILSKLDRHIGQRQLPLDNPLIIVSGLINMVAHYRNFFHVYYACDTRFWLVDSTDNLIARQYLNEFTPITLSPRMTNIYSKIIDILAVLCDYINDVQFASTNVDITTLSIKIASMYPMDPSIIITRDPFVFQAILANNMYVLVPRKEYTSADSSYLVTRDNVVSAYITVVSKKNSTILLPYYIMPYITAIGSVKTRGLRSFSPMPAIIKYITTKGPTEILQISPDTFFDQYCRIKKRTPQDAFELKARFKACDTTNFQVVVYNTLPNASQYLTIKNLYDPEEVKKINNQYFQACPLDLNVL